MSGQAIQIGMLGMGTVGGGVAALLERSGGMLESKTGIAFKLARVAVRDLTRPRAVALPPDVFTTETSVVIEDPSIDLIVELIGGIEPARTLVSEALKRGKYVVTANKDLMARHGAELFEIAHRCGRNIFYEASVGGGIPLVRPLKHCLVANKINRITGIINGTTNYILTRMALDDMDFAEALQKARALGFAEADPSSDLEGRDAAYKLAILAGIAFNSRVHPNDLSVQGIEGVTREDINYARELGYSIKLLAVGEHLPQGLALRVHPALVSQGHPLASVLDEFNAIFIEGDAVGETMFYGRGAGAAPTAGAVVADIVDAARCIRSQLENGVIENGYKNVPKLPVSSLTSPFYLRLRVQDRPGAFGALATAFGNEQVSLDLIIQKRSEGGVAEIVLVTHKVSEELFSRALERIMQLPAIEQAYSVFRVFE